MAGFPGRFVGIDHLVLRVTDVQRTIRFYTEVLGLKVERIFDRINLYQVRRGRNLIDIVPHPGPDALPPPAQRGIEHLCLYVEANLEDLTAHLENAGVPVFMGPMEVYGATGFGTSVYVRDPDGYEVELKVDYARNPVHFSPPPKA